MSVRSVLSTRKIDDSLVAHADRGGITIKSADFISIQTKADEGTRLKVNYVDTEIVVFTSSNAVKAVASLISEGNKSKWLRIYAIEGVTSDLVKELFGHAAIFRAEDASSLAAMIAEKEGPCTVTFFCGNKRRDELPLKLRNAGFIINEQVVYDTVLTARAVNEPFDGIMFFSPSAVQSYFSINVPNEQVVCFSIGSTTTKELTTHTKNRIVTAKQSSERSLVESVLDYFRINTSQ